MNFIFLFILISFSLFKFTSGTNVACNGNGHDGIWTCDKNDDSDALIVTYDCGVNNKKLVEIWLWSQKFPDKMSTLIIQNCNRLLLYTRHGADDPDYYRGLKNPFKVKAESLRIINISDFEQRFNRPSGFRNYLYYEQVDRRKDYRKPSECLLKEVIFENITKSKLDSNFLPDCAISVARLRRLTDFDNYSVIPNINNGIFEIISSNLSSKGINTFAIKNASEVIISNNYFGHHPRQIFNVDAEKIVLTGNEMEYLTSDALSFTSKNLQITNNIFHHIEERAFHLINAMKTNPKINNPRTYNFSNNIMYSLAPNALNIEIQTTLRYFNDLIIVNNSVNCDCASMQWFESIIHLQKRDSQTLRFFKKWSNEKNQNKCLNIPNCFIGQVLNNYYELCEKDYDCPVKNDTEFERDVLNSMSFNNEISQNISNSLQSLLDRIEEIPFKNFDNNLNEEMYRLNIVDSRLLIIIILLAFLLLQITIIIFFKTSIVKVLIAKFGKKTEPLNNETEMS